MPGERFRDLRARIEAARCLFCFEEPCTQSCPAGVPVALFIRQIATGDLVGAAHTIRQANPLGWICGVVCPTEVLCQARCCRAGMDSPVDIGWLQTYATECVPVPSPPWIISPAKRVAVVGGGPAGLTAAICLAQESHQVELFEAREALGGLLTYGIPPHRLPKDQTAAEIAQVERVGVRVHLRAPVENAVGLLQEFDAVLVATGASKPSRLGIEGENLAGIWSGLDFLAKVNKAFLAGCEPDHNLGEQILVIGGGNTALDAAIVARQLSGGQVTVVYRRSAEEMPAWRREVEEARSEGIQFLFQAAPVAFLGREGRVAACRCIRLDLGDPDASGRRRPIPILGSEFVMPCDTAIVAIGQRSDLSLLTGLALKDLLKPRKDACGVSRHTELAPGLFACGDCLGDSTGATVVQAVQAGKEAARAICDFLRAGGGGG